MTRDPLREEMDQAEETFRSAANREEARLAVVAEYAEKVDEMGPGAKIVYTRICCYGGLKDEALRTLDSVLTGDSGMYLGIEQAVKRNYLRDL